MADITNLNHNFSGVVNITLKSLLDIVAAEGSDSGAMAADDDISKRLNQALRLRERIEDR